MQWIVVKAKDRAVCPAVLFDYAPWRYFLYTVTSQTEKWGNREIKRWTERNIENLVSDIRIFVSVSKLRADHFCISLGDDAFSVNALMGLFADMNHRWCWSFLMKNLWCLMEGKFLYSWSLLCSRLTFLDVKVWCTTTEALFWPSFCVAYNF